MFSKNQKNLFACAFSAAFVIVGTYNAVVINSDSDIRSTDVRFVKRLDEVYGITLPGREVAAAVSWKKLSSAKSVSPVIAKNNQIYENKYIETSKKIEPTVQAEAVIPSAAVQEDLSLGLVEVINPKKWEKGLVSGQFNGELTANGGVIENLSVSLPNGEGLSVAFSELSGNVFEYDFDGNLYSGMMYQVDQTSYMVTLTNGPLEGTRLKFATEAPALEPAPVQEYMAETAPQNIYENYNQDKSYAFEGSPESLTQGDQQIQQEAIQAQGLKEDQTQAM